LTAWWTSFDTIAEVLKELIDTETNKMIKVKAKVLHCTMLGFILILMFISQVLFKTKVLAEKLQIGQLDLVIANT